jgi:hypothetical protein
MENLRQINDINYEPNKGDTVSLNSRYGCLLDNEFTQVIWTDNEEIENWVGGWLEFINVGGHILVII